MPEGEKSAAGRRNVMKKVSAILISIVMAVLLAACGGGSSNAGTGGNQGDASRQADTAGGAAGENENSEGGLKEETSGNDSDGHALDAGAVYQKGEFSLADTDRYSAAVSGYLADKDGFSVKLEIGNKAESEYSYYLYNVIVNRGLVNYEITDSAGNNIDELKVSPGGELEANIRIPAAEFEKYKITAADELRFTIAGYPKEEEDEDYSGDDLIEPEDDLEEPLDDLDEPADLEETGEGATADFEMADADMFADLEEADAGVTAEQEAAEAEDSYYSEDFCVYPTGKGEMEITPAQIDTEGDFEWMIQNDQYAFGIRKSLDDQASDSKGVIDYYVENKSDKELDFVLEKLKVNGIPMFQEYTYDASDSEDEATEKAVSDLAERRGIPAGTICLADMLTAKDLADNGVGQISDLKAVLKVEDEEYKEIESREISCQFQDAVSSDAGTASSSSPSESAGPYITEAVKAGESDLYKLSVTGYDQNALVFIVHCEMENKADKAYEYDFYTFDWEINRHFIEDDHEEFYGPDIDNSVEVEAGETAACDIAIPVSSLEAFGIDRVDELQFVVSGRSVDDKEAMRAAYDKGDYFYEEKDGKIYDTVTVHPTGMTDEEINESISVAEKDCAAYIEGDGFTMGILKGVWKDNPYGTLMVYFDNQTNEELYLTWEDISVNGKTLSRRDDFLEKTYPDQVTLRLKPDMKGFVPVLSRNELEKNGITDGIKELDCTVYHKEHPAQGNQFASYSEKIDCSFSDGNDK